MYYLEFKILECKELCLVEWYILNKLKEIFPYLNKFWFHMIEKYENVEWHKRKN